MKAQIKKSISIIELMTVILVVLLLISLLIPVFVNLKMNARSTLCRNQMRQLGIMVSSYTTDHGGYLPNDKSLDLGGSGFSYNTIEAVQRGNNTLLYEGWSGHLLPYFDSVKNFTKISRLGERGIVKTWNFGARRWGEEDSIAPDSSSFIVKDSINNGGYNELKAFICPEISCNTYEISYSNIYNGVKIPRISQMSTIRGFWDSYVDSGVPTTYFANNIFFGCDNINTPEDITGELKNSLRLDQISDVSQKAFVIEGGSVQASWPWYSGPYYQSGDLDNLSIVRNKLNFVHDNLGAFWLLYVNRYTMDDSMGYEMMSKFNTKFSGKAEMITRGIQFTIISYVYPSIDPVTGKNLFTDFFIAKPMYNLVSGFSTFDLPEFHYKTGSMNVLFGDGAVALKSYSWLSQNKELISNLSNP